MTEGKALTDAETEDLREFFEERAGILQYDAGLPKPEAEIESARITATLARNRGYLWASLRAALADYPLLLSQVPDRAGTVDSLPFGTARVHVREGAKPGPVSGSVILITEAEIEAARQGPHRGEAGGVHRGSGGEGMTSGTEAVTMIMTMSGADTPSPASNAFAWRTLGTVVDAYWRRRHAGRGPGNAPLGDRRAHCRDCGDLTLARRDLPAAGRSERGPGYRPLGRPPESSPGFPYASYA